MTPPPRLVPDRPTPEMLRAAVECRYGDATYKCVSSTGTAAYESEAADDYAAMLAAAPPAEATAHPSRAEPVAWPKGWSAADWAAWLRDRGESFDPHVQGPLFEALAAHIETMLATHPSRGVVDESAMERALSLFSEYEQQREYNPRVIRRILEAAALPVATPAELAAEYARGRVDGWEARKAHAALPAVPEDFVLVPMEATGEMSRAGWLTCPDTDPTEDEMCRVYAAMIAAAPAQEAP